MSKIELNIFMSYGNGLKLMQLRIESILTIVIWITVNYRFQNNSIFVLFAVWPSIEWIDIADRDCIVGSDKKQVIRCVAYAKVCDWSYLIRYDYLTDLPLI